MFSIVTFATSMPLSLANSGHCANVEPVAGHDCVGRLIIHHEHGFDRRRRMLVAVADERVDIGEGEVVAAGCNAGDRVERRGRVVHAHVQPSALEIAPVQRKQDQRVRSFDPAIEREFDGRLGSGGGGKTERGCDGDQIGEGTYPPEIEEAHGLPYSLYTSPAAASPGRDRGWRGQKRT